ncbi:tautomerase family protein [Pengzhenrongella sp.]|jgi:phenylpyruvate tautomerase PptA (4-oxalocrotonate tautomerase family)|uniref:tautomerase family protein n=1 Tax=Pengzhenrongella sp. TaxID=2888820 RepID=UPI002F94DF15
MAQFKIYGRRGALDPVRSRLSDVVHACAVDVLQLPPDKRFHRFFPMSAEDFPTPPGRTERYTIVEILMFEGRSVATKKALYARLYRDFSEQLGIDGHDLEITVLETPRHDWAIRGLPGDELTLSYRVDQ